MQNDRKPAEEQDSNKALHLNDYAGDEEDDKKAKEQANNYSKDVDETTTQNANKKVQDNSNN